MSINLSYLNLKKKFTKWLIPRLSDIMDTYQGLFVKIDDYNTIPNSTYKIIYKLPPKNVFFFLRVNK